MKKSYFALIMVLLLGISSCASVDEILVNKEAGFFYGYASGASEEEADQKAFDDLIYSVLTETASVPKERKANFVIHPEMKAAFLALELKPYSVDKKTETDYQVVYRLEQKVWDKAESARLDTLRADLGAEFTNLQQSKAKNAEKMAKAAALFEALEHQGVVNSLKDASGKTLYKTVQDWFTSQYGSAGFSIEPSEGLIDSTTALILTVQKNQSPAKDFPVRYWWTADKVDSEPTEAFSAADGTLRILLPKDDFFLNKKLDLKLTSNTQSADTGRKFLQDLDNASLFTRSYRHDDSLLSLAAAEILVPAGTYTIGAVKHDRWASGIEKSRKVTLPAYYMDKDLVTNRQYMAFLEATKAPRSSYPDYWDNEDYNKPDQPVIGVSYADAQKYAAWISEQLGYTKRLPSEAEYEVAARLNENTIYPWGDEEPIQGPRANYSGNGRFATSSPVGSFPEGNTKSGLSDMVGNVWEWTSSLPEGSMSGDANFHIVKGGSWMDGPRELRISNRILRDPELGYGDLGFRLVRDASTDSTKGAK